jgi:hypothetical protein
MATLATTAPAERLVERSAELEFLEQAFIRVRDGGAGELLFVAGEAGVGSDRAQNVATQAGSRA